MLDTEGRVTIGKELISRTDLEMGKEVYIYYNPKERELLIKKNEGLEGDSNYFVKIHILDKKGRLYIPTSVREAFPGATYLPAEKNGDIYIFIIEHNKKPE